MIMLFWVLFKKEMREQLRTFRPLIGAVVFLILGISAPVVTSLTPSLLSNVGHGIKITLPPQTAIDALNAYLKNTFQLAPLVLVLLTMGCVSEERTRGTAVTVLTKPVPRSIFILAKFGAYELTLIFRVIFAGAAMYYYTAQLFSALPVGGFLLINLALLILLSIVLALTVFASALFRNTIVAGGVALVGSIAFLLIGSFNTSIIQFLPSTFFTPDHATQIMAGTLTFTETLQPFVVGGSLTAALVILACLIFHYQDL